MPSKLKKSHIATRFRGLLPVVIDLETSGLNPITDAIIEIAVVPLAWDKEGRLTPKNTLGFHVEPFYGAHIDPESIELTRIDLGQPLRFAIPEKQMLHRVFTQVSQWVQDAGCQRAVLVGHNAWFDLAFLQTAIKRCRFKQSPFHSFTCFDTATLAGVSLGETVLAKALRAARIPFDVTKAHSAIYDAERTAELFCYILNVFNEKF